MKPVSEEWLKLSAEQRGNLHSRPQLFYRM
jgi:hypothetical protein